MCEKKIKLFLSSCDGVAEHYQPLFTVSSAS